MFRRRLLTSNKENSIEERVPRFRQASCSFSAEGSFQPDRLRVLSRASGFPGDRSPVRGFDRSEDPVSSGPSGPHDDRPVPERQRKRAGGPVPPHAQEGQCRFSNAPESTSLETFGTVSTLRWSIEPCFLAEEDKSCLGMSHYEHRSWRAWNRHMLYVFLADLFITTVRIKLGEKKGS